MYPDVWKSQIIEINGDTMGVSVLRLFRERKFGYWEIGEKKQLFISFNLGPENIAFGRSELVDIKLSMGNPKIKQIVEPPKQQKLTIDALIIFFLVILVLNIGMLCLIFGRKQKRNPYDDDSVIEIPTKFIKAKTKKFKQGGKIEDIDTFRGSMDGGVSEIQPPDDKSVERSKLDDKNDD